MGAEKSPQAEMTHNSGVLSSISFPRLRSEVGSACALMGGSSVPGPRTSAELRDPKVGWGSG